MPRNELLVGRTGQDFAPNLGHCLRIHEYAGGRTDRVFPGHYSVEIVGME